jgi:3D (Asp-Asp-Asp) domain-containing protein
MRMLEGALVLVLMTLAVAAPAQAPTGHRLLGEFAPSTYGRANEAEWPVGGETEPLLTRDGRLIARVAPAFKRRLDTEGSARLRDARIVNLHEEVEGRWRYVVVHDAPFGLAAPGYKFVPYRTVAVDPKRIKLGSVLYLPALVGLRLPSGDVHDGFVFAHDTWPGFTENSIDIFVGFENDRDNALTRSGRLAAKPVPVYEVDASTATQLTERFKAQFLRVPAVAAPAQAPAGYRLLGEFAPTAYRILNEAEWPVGGETEPLLTRDGRLIARVAPAFKRRLDTEGSARLRDARIVNFHEKVEGRWRYLVAPDASFGLAATGDKLIPFRTVAVDPKRIKLGSVLYVPTLVGVRLPSGDVHDGFVFAHDTGQGITGNRIDIFVGFEDDLDNTLTRSGHLGTKPIRIYQVDAGTVARLTARFKGQFERRP